MSGIFPPHSRPHSPCSETPPKARMLPSKSPTGAKAPPKQRCGFLTILRRAAFAVVVASMVYTVLLCFEMTNDLTSADSATTQDRNDKHRHHEKRAATKQVSPSASQLLVPFTDLCESVVRNYSADAQAAVSDEASKASGESIVAFKEEVDQRMKRFEFVPADGGAAGERWSQATGLPMAADRAGSEVKVRFLSSISKLDSFAHFATVAASLAGARLDILGKGWRHFSFMKRMAMMLSYAEHEGLADADIIVAVDTDAVFSGEDAMEFFSAFAASTAASEAEHLNYSVRDIRDGKRLSPVLFSSEYHCMHTQAVAPHFWCTLGYETLNRLRDEWAKAAGVKLQPHQYESNPFKYLNAGALVTRVWALRLLNAAFLDFAKTHRPNRRGREWWCDQTAVGMLYLDLRWWEYQSKALDGAPVELSEATQSESIYPPLVLPEQGRGPHGLPAGFIGVDHSGRFALTIGPELSRRRFYRISGTPVRSNYNPLAALEPYLAKREASEVSPMGLVQSRHRIEIAPRNNVDCTGVASTPPQCAYRDAVYGIPEGAKTVVPILWHFSGKRKKATVEHFRAIFPWYTPTLSDPTALHALVRTLAYVPPTRHFAVDSATDRSNFYTSIKLLPYNPSNSISTEQLCRRTVLQQDT